MDKKGIQLSNNTTEKGISIVIGDTKVSTDGQPINIRFEKQMGYVYILLDCSGSMAGNKIKQAKEGIIDFAKDAFIKEYFVGLISFDSLAKIICKPTSDINLITNSLEKMLTTGTTNMADAIILAHHELKSTNYTRYIVIATDGQPDNEQFALTAGQRAKADNIDIIAIGTDGANQDFLRKIASKSELSNKVLKEEFGVGISSSVKLLPPPKRIIKQ
jgi:Mg-chelatase subunit ChlD